MSSLSPLRELYYLVFWHDDKTTSILESAHVKADKQGCRAKWINKWLPVKIVAQDGNGNLTIIIKILKVLFKKN